MSKPIKLPGPDHPIAITPTVGRVVVTVAGRVIADTRRALTLKEASYPAVQYIPREDADMSLLTRTGHTTTCPYKGDCSYYSIAPGGERPVNAVWTYGCLSRCRSDQGPSGFLCRPGRCHRDSHMSALFTPIALRGLTLRNRIVISPMCQYSATDGEAAAWRMIHLGSLAPSGAGLLRSL